MFTLLLFSATAAPADTVDALVGRLTGSSPPEQVCAEAFLGREVRGCKALVGLIREHGVEPARRAASKEEALVELWLGTGPDRWPITLLARPTDAGWRFVDATDADGPTLKTDLKLAGADDPNPTPVEADVAAFLKRLNDAGMKTAKVCAGAAEPDACAAAVEQAHRKELRFRPTQQLIRGERLWVQAIVQQGGRSVDEVRFSFEKSRKRWAFAAIDEEPMPR